MNRPVQPFRHGRFYRSGVWPEATIRYVDEHLVMTAGVALQVVSSALWGGGVRLASHFVNWQVPRDYHTMDPVLAMEKKIKSWGYPAEQTIGLQTAAKLTHAAVMEEEAEQFRAICCVTAGTGNAARAGRKRRTYPLYRCGTINVMVIIDANVTPSAMINAIATVTEAKAAALQDLRITVGGSGEIATGTTTDAIVLAASQNSRYTATHPFAGHATVLGNALGYLAYQAVFQAVATQREP